MRILDLVSPKQLSRVASLQLLARGIVEGFCSGRHRSPHRGFSVEFKEHRPYVRGDELKNIDWKAFAKSDRLYIREHEEETNLRCTLLVDRSGSMLYRGDRGGGLSKDDYTQRLAASLAYLMLGQQDGVGVITFDSIPRNIVATRSRASHLKAVLAALVGTPEGIETDLGGALATVVPKMGRRGLVVILSDAMGDLESLGRSLAQIRSRKHEVVFFQVLDPDEVDFPFSGRIQFRDLEQTAEDQTVDAASIRSAYLDRLDTHLTQLRDLCRRNRVDLVPLRTDQSFDDALHQYVALRRRIG
ncbi:DUF58 domain-containing protein [Novipirellula artificiosorum]|uniref:DUF58 domain-containing protein n=1 Tax=Novipirellula artificiosorum TaxID=2528016 RepID=A0A5C6DCE0_9BACT|nr:DUF58 domain-containing protein [Novipirellula artificiosorum]TWU33381.1 hypothetical protein Poly41_51350 [Novipirellula artificiosorum]